MDREFTERMKTALIELKKSIIDNLIAENTEFKEIVEGINPKDLVDIAADDIDRRTIEAIGAQEVKRLRLIDAALSRVENEKYGLCMKCGKKIPEERLLAIPYALMCIDCKTVEERRTR